MVSTSTKRSVARVVLIASIFVAVLLGILWGFHHTEHHDDSDAVPPEPPVEDCCTPLPTPTPASTGLAATNNASPRAPGKPFEPTGGQNSNVATKATCPKNGRYAPLSGSCGKLPRASFGFNSSTCPASSAPVAQGLSCGHLNAWTPSKTGWPQHSIGNTTGAVVTVSNAQLFNVAVTKTSLGNVLSAFMQLSVMNSGSCTSNFTSLLVLLEQSNVGGNDSYGPGGANQKLWAVSGTENSASAGKCNSPGLAQICYEQSCNVTVPYISGTLYNGTSQQPLNLSTLVIPANTKTCAGGIKLNLSVAFLISDANLTLMQNNLNNYRLSVLGSFDACCDRGSSCGIDIDCRGGLETINTAVIRTAYFSLPPCSGSQRCNSVRVTDTAVTVNNMASNVACVGSATLATPLNVTTTVTLNQLLVGTETCNTASCSCSGSGQYVVRVINNAPGLSVTSAVANDSCIHPVTGLSLINPTVVTATHNFSCVLPAPVNCVVSAWSAWSPTGTCLFPACQQGSERTRTIITQPCHGGAPCPALSEQTPGNTPCSTPACTYNNNGAECTMGPCNSDSCMAVETCRTDADQSGYCTAGTSHICLDQVVHAPTSCILPCNYTEWSAWSDTSVCASTGNGTCGHNQTRTRSVNFVCPQNTVCEPLEEVRTVECACPPVCNETCTYGEWTEWAVFGQCLQSPFPDLCFGNATRYRPLITACPLEAAGTCAPINEFGQNIPCTCIPPLVPQCQVHGDCQALNLCQTFWCINNQCVVASDTICLSFDPCIKRNCNPSTGACDVIPKDCNDGSNCTLDSCNSTNGQCINEVIKLYNTTSNPCYYTQCVGIGGNLWTPIEKVCPVGTTCNPLDPSGSCRPPCVTDADCSWVDGPGTCDDALCVAGVCQVGCPPGTSCNPADPAGECRPPCTSDSNCTWLESPSACTTAVCSSGSCFLSPIFCGIGFACDPFLGCVSTTPCPGKICAPDQYLNTSNCQCYCNQTLCASSSTSCTIASCNATTNSCELKPKNCDDGNTCTSDRCSEGLGCTYSAIVSCPTDPCHSSPCINGQGCVTTPVNCSDGNPATIDSCSTTLPNLGCIHQNPSCDDGDECTLDPVDMYNGVCLPKVSISDCCNANHPCPGLESCINGTCVTTAINIECVAPGSFSTTIMPCTRPPCPSGYVCSGSSCLLILSSGSGCKTNDPCNPTGLCFDGVCVPGFGGCGVKILGRCYNPVCTAAGCQMFYDHSYCNTNHTGTINTCDPDACNTLGGLNAGLDCYHDVPNQPGTTFDSCS